MSDEPAGGDRCRFPTSGRAPYWEAAAEHVLAIGPLLALRHVRASRPTSSARTATAPSPTSRFEPVSGRGVVRSWTVVHQSFLPGFDDLVPFVLVDVELEEQADLRMIGRLLDGPEVLDDPDAALAIGARVVVAFEDLAPGTSVPAFALEDGRP